MGAVTRIMKRLAPRGLAARAVLFTTVLMMATALLSAATIMFGADRESARHQLVVTGELTQHLASVSGNLIAQRNVAELQSTAAIATSRRAVRRIVVHDEQGRIVAQHGGSASDRAATEWLSRRVAQTSAPTYLRTADNGLALGAPVIHNGERLGVAVMMWDGDAYRFNALPALAPFLLILICLAGAAVPLTAHLVRRTVAPLDELSRFAARIGEQGQAEPIRLQTGDEFETLANAFNSMIGKLDASMQRIQQIAFVDPVTQLPNHDRFVREIDFFILQAKPHTGAVLVFELQRLQRLMQAFDPASAREFLRDVADRISRSLATVDKVIRAAGAADPTAMVARLGLVEFGVFGPKFNSASDVANFAQHLNAALNQPFEWRGHKLTLGACCGVALAPRDGKDAETIIRHARMALSAASPTRVKVYTRSLDREALARLTLEREMRGALESNEFRAYFQPKINLATGRIEACEALARWIRPDRTIISPGRFIPVAEESGLIGPLSEAIMREACWKAASWARAGHPTKVAVNVSALQFRSERFSEHVLRIVQHAGLAPQALELEITESVVMEDPDRALHVIRPLRAAGVRLAIDDFGCGHSNLAALSTLPFDVIKIDQQFVRALERGDAQAPAIIEMILALARTLNMEVVAEGIERREEMEFMAARGCQWIQGFLYGAAVSAPEFAELLRVQCGEDVVSENAA